MITQKRKGCTILCYDHELLESIFIHNASFRVWTGKSHSIRGENVILTVCRQNQSMFKWRSVSQSLLVSSRFKSIKWLWQPSSDLCDDSADLSVVGYALYACCVFAYIHALKHFGSLKYSAQYVHYIRRPLSVQALYGRYSLSSFMLFAPCIVI
jgi:hypothetical protein